MKTDPWTRSEPDGGRLCARFTGGTVTYMSPEQSWLLKELNKHTRGDEHYCELKDLWQVTPAICDLYQASLVVLEMHSREAPPKRNPDYAHDRVEAVQLCANRGSRDTIVGLSPVDTERWVVEDLGQKQYAGKIASNNVSGELMMRISSMTLAEAKKVLTEVLTEVPGPVALHIHNASKAASKTLRTDTDSMRDSVQFLLEKSLSHYVTKRPATASLALKELEDPQLYKYLPQGLSGSRLKSIDHDDKDVSSTLGGLAKLMLLHGGVPSSLTTCAEWVGTSSNDEARAAAQSAYCDLLKRHADEILELELSRSTHSNWSRDMLAGEHFVDELAISIWTRGVLKLEAIDMSEQSMLSGEVLSKLLRETGISTLRNLTLRGCSAATGEIPASIERCTALVSLDLHNANHIGELPSTLATLSSIEHLDLGKNRFRGNPLL